MPLFLKTTFNQPQINGLADLCLSISKGMFLAALAAPVISPSQSIITIFSSLKTILGGLLFALLALKFLELKEVD